MKAVSFKISNTDNDGVNFQFLTLFFLNMIVWAKVANVDFQKVASDDPNVDIRIYFGYLDHGDSWPFDGPNR